METYRAKDSFLSMKFVKSHHQFLRPYKGAHLASIICSRIISLIRKTDLGKLGLKNSPIFRSKIEKKESRKGNKRGKKISKSSEEYSKEPLIKR